jgi:hypothetical protein
MVPTTPPTNGKLNLAKEKNRKPSTPLSRPRTTFTEMNPLTVRLPGRPASASLF